MNAVWSYFWPVFAAGMLCGAIAGLIAFRQPRMKSKDRIAGTTLIIQDWRRNRLLALVIGLTAAMVLTALWHGPLGAADRFASQVERNVRATLVNNEIPQVSGRLHRGPLTRRVALSGQADDFQRSELVRIIGGLPGVSTASWSGASGGLPLVAEACIVALLGFLTGLLLAYLVELRRRYNMQWKW